MKDKENVDMLLGLLVGIFVGGLINELIVDFGVLTEIRVILLGLYFIFANVATHKIKGRMDYDW